MITESKIVTLFKSDIPMVVKFLQMKYDDLGRSIDYWNQRTELWWKSNPYHDLELPIGWGIVYETNLVGFLGCIFTKLVCKERSFYSLNLTCWHVDVEYRSKSLELFLIANSYMTDAIYFNTSPTIQVEKILNVAKYKKYILDNEKLFCKLFPFYIPAISNKVKTRLLKFAIMPLLYVLNFLLKCFLIFFKGNKNLTVISFAEIKEGEIEKFIESLNMHEITIERSYKFYSWLCTNSEKKYYAFFIKEKVQNKIVGIALFQTVILSSINVLELVDFISTKNSSLNQRTIFRTLLLYLFENNSKFSEYFALSFTDFSGLDFNNIPGIAFFRSRNNKYFKTNNTALNQKIKESDYFFSAQGDMYL